MRRLSTLALAGCTFSPGTGFSSLTGGELEARFEAGAARDLGEGVFLTDMGFEVGLDLLVLEVGSLELMELSGGEGVDFDPADPPEGYSLCHGGHCHADDGSLPTYAEIRVAISGGAATLLPVASLPVDSALDLVDGSTRSLQQVEPSTELPMASITEARLGLQGLRLEGRASGDGLDEAAITVELPLEDSLVQVLAFDVDRDAPEQLSLEAALLLDGRLLDGLALDTLAGEGGIVVEDRESEAGRALVENLLRGELQVDLIPHRPR